ncbi:cell division protein FtsA [Fervidicella metallireducens AeB]|uniref:Cell division protein FtsA n=1 Tax=Fervidicella metallireducens AeB TaxID=1403537 RepID=A0A017RUQ1_9CLOT|nr:cell division protein FtsA [Fervidicella metallireducens]EYE88412.1 cell division protein FtsA [Fervidicella metallireducens AeB]
MSNIVVSLDIGSSKVCVLIAELNKKQFNILGVGTSECKGVKKGIIVDIDSTVDAIKNAVKQAEQMSNREIKSVYVNICGGYANLYRNKGVIAVTREDREITAEDVKRVMQAAKVVAVPADKEIIDIIPEQFIVDGYEEIRDPIGMVGVRLEVDANLVVASCTSVQNIRRSIQKAGLTLDGIVLEPLGTAAAILNEDEMELGVALVDVGAETTDISVFKKGSLVFTKVIPVGGNHITNDISIISKISSSDAEKIKKQYGVASVKLVKNDDIIKINNIAGKGEKEIHLSDVAQIMDARISEILFLIRKQLEENNMLASLSAGVVITGGGLFNIKGIQDVAQSYFDVPVRLGYPNYIGVANPTYAAATGIAIYSLKQKRTSSISSKSVNVSDEAAVEIDDEYSLEAKPGIIEKIKEFFADFF